MVRPRLGESGAERRSSSLADLNDLQIELDISQQDFARLKMDQRAEIIPEAFPELEVLGISSPRSRPKPIAPKLPCRSK